MDFSAFEVEFSKKDRKRIFSFHAFPEIGKVGKVPNPAFAAGKINIGVLYFNVREDNGFFLKDIHAHITIPMLDKADIKKQ